jgi:hypothetical protein
MPSPTPALPILKAAYPWLGFPGLAWSVQRSIITKTTIQTTMTGRTVRLARYPIPLFGYRLEFTLLRDRYAIARTQAKSAPYNEFETLFAFFQARLGQYEPFFIVDPTDSVAVNQLIMASTAASVTDYQLVRTVNGYTAPVGGMHETATAVVRVNGTPTTAYSKNVPFDGWIRFDAAPTAASEITADFTYYQKVTFGRDQLDFLTPLVNRWEAKRVELDTVLP